MPTVATANRCGHSKSATPENVNSEDVKPQHATTSKGKAEVKVPQEENETVPTKKPESRHEDGSKDEKPQRATRSKAKAKVQVSQEEDAVPPLKKPESRQEDGSKAGPSQRITKSKGKKVKEEADNDDVSVKKPGRKTRKDSEEEYDVEKLLGKKVDAKKGVLYLVKWKDYPKSESTWEPLCNLLNTWDLIEELEKELARDNETLGIELKPAKQVHFTLIKSKSQKK